MHSYSCVVCRSSSGNQRTCLLDMGGVMKKFEITINASFIVEAEDEEEAKEEALLNYVLDKHDLEVDEVEVDEVEEDE